MKEKSIITGDTALAPEDLIGLCNRVSDLVQDADEHTIEHLFALLGHEHPFVRSQAGEALAKLAADAQARREGFWSRAVRRTDGANMQGLLVMAEDTMASSQATHRAAVIDALGQWHHTGSLGLLRDALDDPDAAVRSAAVRALGLNQDTDSTDRLLELLQRDGSLWVRLAAADALGNLGQERVTPALRDLVLSLDEHDDAGPLDEAGNASERSMLRIRLVNALGHMNHPQARAMLMTFAKCDDDTLRWYAARGLQHIGDASALTVLKPLLADDALLFDHTVGEVAQEAIDRIQHREQGMTAWLRQAAYGVSMVLKRIWKARPGRRE